MNSITVEEAKKIIPSRDKEALKIVAQRKEPVFKVNFEVRKEKNSLVDLEVSIRKLQRFGGLKA